MRSSWFGILSTPALTMACTSDVLKVDDETPSGHDPSGSPPFVHPIDVEPPSLAEDSLVTLTATVTDNDGLDDLVGGKLTSAEGSKNYGAFLQLAPGTYSITLTWDQVHAVEPISFIEGSTHQRNLRVIFTDAAQHQGLRAVDLVLACADGSCAPYGTCGKVDGTCAEWALNELAPDDLCGEHALLYETFRSCVCSGNCTEACAASPVCNGGLIIDTECLQCTGETCRQHADACAASDGE